MVFGGLLIFVETGFNKTPQPIILIHFIPHPMDPAIFQRLTPEITPQSLLKRLQNGEPGGDRFAMAGPTGHHLVAWRMARLDEGCEQIKILTYGE